MVEEFSCTSTTKMATHLGSFLLVLLLFFSCTNRSWELVSEDDARHLLPRYALLSAGLQYKGAPDSIRQAAYRQLLEQEGYTLNDWDSSMLWYAKNNMPLYHDFYRLASDSLSKQTELLQKRADSIMREEERERKFQAAILDSANLLRLGSQLAFSGQLVNQSFSLRPSIAYNGVEGVLSTRILGLPKLSDKESFSLELKFHAQDSTSRFKRIRIKNSGVYKLRLITMDGKDVVRISGYLRGVTPQLRPGTFVLIDSLRFVRTPHTNIPNPKQVPPTTDNSTSPSSTQATCEPEDVVDLS